MARISWANAAVDDLQRLREYFTGVSPRFAEKLMDQLISRARMLADFPQSGRTVPEFENPQLREVMSGNYRIIYRLEQLDKVEIARVFHSAQLLDEL